MLGKEGTLNIISELKEFYHKATLGKCGFVNLASFPFPWELLGLALVTCLTQARPSVMMGFAIHPEQATGKMTRLAVSYKNTHKSQLSPSNIILPDKKRGLWLKLLKTETSLGLFLFSWGSAQGLKEGEGSQPGGDESWPCPHTALQ